MTTEHPPAPDLTRTDTGYPHPVYAGYFLTPAAVARCERQAEHREQSWLAARERTDALRDELAHRDAERKRIAAERRAKSRAPRTTGRRCRGCDAPLVNASVQQRYCSSQCREARMKAKGTAARILREMGR